MSGHFWTLCIKELVFYFHKGSRWLTILGIKPHILLKSISPKEKDLRRETNLGENLRDSFWGGGKNEVTPCLKLVKIMLGT